jgi:hypothetical protein
LKTLTRVRVRFWAWHKNGTKRRLSARPQDEAIESPLDLRAISADMMPEPHPSPGSKVVRLSLAALSLALLAAVPAQAVSPSEAIGRVRSAASDAARMCGEATGRLGEAISRGARGAAVVRLAEAAEGDCFGARRMMERLELDPEIPAGARPHAEAAVERLRAAFGRAAEAMRAAGQYAETGSSRSLAEYRRLSSEAKDLADRARPDLETLGSFGRAAARR